ncbi:hypothetical protein [Aquimarina sp. LLG6339-5]|uniref:hypothetical protein n=1 Tax=Aquimarina sp. LLG6339-5 TaxID=3160830 RepID=UPI003864C596
MIHKILNLNGVTPIKKEDQKSITGGTHECQNMARRCIDDNDCCSGKCGVEKIINGNIITLAICSFS